MDSNEIIRKLGLFPHPEGGFFREFHRSEIRVDHPRPGGVSAIRSAMTTIYFLLPQGVFSAWHRVRSDEVWCLLAGGPLELHQISPSGEHALVRLGSDLAADQAPAAVVPAGWLQAARPGPEAEFALCACSVGPGFEFDDFEMPSRERLLALHPSHSELIEQFTR